MCGFDSDWCGFENSVSQRGHWGRRKGAEHQVDHTYGTEQGEQRLIQKHKYNPTLICKNITSVFGLTTNVKVLVSFSSDANQSNGCHWQQKWKHLKSLNIWKFLKRLLSSMSKAPSRHIHVISACCNSIWELHSSFGPSLIILLNHL